MVIVPYIIQAVVSAAISMAVSWLFAPSVKGPRLKDLGATGQGYGPPIPRVYGTVAVPGSIIWASPLIERKKKSGGKGGGGSTTTYTYSQHVALAVCEGPATVTRIWAGGQLIWDVSNPTTTKKKSKKQVIAYNDVTVYTGSESQGVSSLIESYMGAGTTPAYRGLCYVTLQSMQLAKFGNRLPPFQIEVTTASQRTLVSNINLSALTYAGPTSAVGYTLSGFNANDLVMLDHPGDGTYAAWSPYSSDSEGGGYPYATHFSVTAGATTTTYWQTSGNLGGRFATAAAADAYAQDQAPIYLTGATSYTLWMYDDPAADNRYGLSLRVSKIEGGLVSLADVVAAECELGGLSASQYDVSGLSGYVEGFNVARPMSPRDALESLRAAYFFDAAESDGQVKFVMRGGAVAASIAEADLGATENNEPSAEPFVISRANEQELPQQVDVHYYRRGSEYEEGVRYERVMNTDSTALHSMELALVLSDEQAADVAAVTLHTTRLERTSFQFTTSKAYSHLEPMDVVNVTYGGTTYTVRIINKDEAGGVITFKAVAEDTSLYVDIGALSTTSTASQFYTASADGTVGGVPSSNPGSPSSADDAAIADIAPTNAIFMDLPPLLASHDSVGLCLAVAPSKTLSTDEWEGAVNFYSLDGGASFIEGSTLDAVCVVGTANATLGNHSGGHTVDFFNTLSVTMVGELESTTWSGLLAGQNALLVGSEIIQFQTATLTASTTLTNTYTLSKLLRGRRGTEQYISTHGASETVVLLDSQIARLAVPETRLGTTVYRTATVGEDVDDLTNETVTNSGVCLKPWAPTDLRAYKSAAASWDIQLSWKRRDRLHQDSMLWLADIPMSESAETYDIEIYTTDFATLKRTVSANASTAYTYTNAMQVTDFGSTQSAVGVKVYQNSATIGRGFAASQALTVY